MKKKFYKKPFLELIKAENTDVMVTAGSTPTEEGEYQTSGTTELDDGSGDITALSKGFNVWDEDMEENGSVWK